MLAFFTSEFWLQLLTKCCNIHNNSQICIICCRHLLSTAIPCSLSFSQHFTIPKAIPSAIAPFRSCTKFVLNNFTFYHLIKYFVSVFRLLFTVTLFLSLRWDRCSVQRKFFNFSVFLYVLCMVLGTHCTYEECYSEPVCNSDAWNNFKKRKTTKKKQHWTLNWQHIHCAYGSIKWTFLFCRKLWFG